MIKRKAGTLMSDSVPDVGQLVTIHLKINLREQYIEARVLKYLMDFYKIVEDHGLDRIVGAGTVYDEDGRQSMKARC
ncbi:hypothetical protein PsorP6_006021 [Peronosclerospora sorghi]|uniref:Uncharacterized protein n=1 Tax=Peronosclerospora sorghi TaxID=230839 RepID=A0ACC0W557_9STRA|nr:hypothetical protein PsorP6_006021 [Peronosclerospora sorghi]